MKTKQKRAIWYSCRERMRARYLEVISNKDMGIFDGEKIEESRYLMVTIKRLVRAGILTQEEYYYITK